MTTPFDSSPNSAVRLPSSDYRIDALVGWDSSWSYKWGGPLGAAATVTYSFPVPGSVWTSAYGFAGSDEPNRGLRYLDAVEQAAARMALQAWGNIANINFVEVADTAHSVGDIRFARTAALPSDVAAHAYAPDVNPEGGDVWLADDVYLGSALSSPEGLQLLLHEIGHALGLNHPFEGPVQLPSAEDNYNFTVMSYTRGSAAIPTTPAGYDVMAITYLYGAKGSSGVGLPGDYFMYGSDGADILSALTGNDTLLAYAGNDAMYGGSGNDWLDGGAGRDTAVFVGPRASYTVTGSEFFSRVTGPEGADELADVERLHFTDRKIALDLSPGEAAGNSVRLIGAAFDTAYIPQLAGVGIALFDAGQSMSQVAQLAIDTALFQSLTGTRSNIDFVNTVFRNVVGRLPTATERDGLVGMLQGSGGSLTQADLLVIAANHPMNETNIGLVGLQQTGVDFV